MEQSTLERPIRVSRRREGSLIGPQESRDLALLLLVALVVLMEAFGRQFSKIGIEDASVYVTEVFLVAIIAAIAWTRRAELVTLVRDRWLTVLLGAFWLAGLVALLRGVADHGVALTLKDVGLVEYSVLLPIVLLVVGSSDRRAELLTRAFAYGGIATMALFGATNVALRTGTRIPLLDELEISGVGPAMYMSFYVAWVAAQLVQGRGVGRWHGGLAVAGLVLIGLTDARGGWLCLIAALAVVVLAAPSWRARWRGALAAGAAVVVCIGGGFLVETALGPVQPLPGDEVSPLFSGDVRGEGDDEAQIGSELRGLGGALGGDATSGEGANVEWRLDFWEELGQRSLDSPLTGAGFGQPAAFRWNGIKYDFRESDPREPFDVSGPHNDLVHVMYRMGFLALAALLAMVGLAVVRAVRSLRAGERGPGGTRYRTVATLAMLASTIVVISLNDAIKGPFLGIFFWAALGLVLANARIGSAGETSAAPR